MRMRNAMVLILCVALLTAGCGNKVEEASEDTGTNKKNIVVTTEDKEPEVDTKPTEDVVQEQELLPVVEGLAAGLSGGEWSVYVLGLNSGREASVNAKAMQSASLIKLFIAGAVYDRKGQSDAQSGEQDVDQDTDELLRSMITVSDNEAANTLVTRLGQGSAEAGMKAVNEFAAGRGCADTHMGRLMLDFDAADDNYTSAADCGRYLKAIYSGETEGAGQILDFMKQQSRTGKIPSGIPEGTVTANKTGELGTVENDAAIVWGDKEPYILCVMSQNLADPAAARQSIQELSAGVYELMQQ